MKILILLTFFLLFANCTNKLAIDHHGVHKLNIKQEKLFPSQTNKNDIIKILGPPSVESTFNEEVLFFIERKISNTSTFKLGKQAITTNNVLIVELDSYGILKKKDFYDLTKMNKLKFSKNKTSVDYSKKNFIYNFLSSMRQKVNDPLGKKRSK